MSARILIVDDDVETLRLVGLMLERKGYEIQVAPTGTQGLEKALKEKPDLIILDVMMPDLDGYEITRRLRGNPQTESIPILMFTAKTTIPDKIAGFHSGADEYLTKPVHPAELVNRMEALLQRSSRRPLPPEIKRGRLIAFLPTKGGVGNSSLVLNAAIELNRTHPDKKAVVVDLHSGNGTLALQLGLSDKHSLHTLMERGTAALTADGIEGQIITHNTGLHLLLTTFQPAGITPEFTEDFTRGLLRVLLTEYDFILLDLPLLLDKVGREVLRQANYILLTLEPDKIGLALAKAMLASLDQINITRHKVGLVMIQRLATMPTLSRDAVEAALQQPLLGYVPPAPELAQESLETSKPMITLQPQSALAQQIRLIMECTLHAL
jgi:pilus assembly protein CpaE